MWYEIMRFLGLVLTHIEVSGRVFGCFCLLEVYACSMMITKIQIQRYRWDIRLLRPVWVHTEALGFVLGCFCLLGIRLCMHRYDEIWLWDNLYSSKAWQYADNTSLPVRWGLSMRYDKIYELTRVASGHDSMQIVRHYPSVEVRVWDMMRYMR